MLKQKIKLKTFLTALFLGSVFLLFSAQNAQAYANSSEWISPVKAYGFKVSFGAISWTEVALATGTSPRPTNSSVVMEVRAGDTDLPDGTWTNSGNWTVVTNGQSLAFLGDKKNIQYRVSFSYDNSNEPGVADVTIPYSYFPTTPQQIVSSPYNTQDPANLLAKIQWSENTPSGTNVKFQVRTAPDNGGNPNWANGSGWCGPTNCAATKNDADFGSDYYQTNPAGENANAIHGIGGNDQWVQYVVWLETSDTVGTPVLTDTTLTYVVNVPPQIQSVSATQTNPGDKVTFSYAIKDADTASGFFTPNFVTQSFQYSLDGGSSWQDITSDYYNYNSPPFGGQITDTNFDGKMDNKVSAGSFLNYSINWNAQAQLGVTTNLANAQVRVTVNDNEAANNLATLATSNFNLSTLALANIAASQSTQDATLGKVIVTFDLAIQSNIQASTNLVLQYWNGSTWVNAATTTGDAGSNVSSGSKQIVWNAKQDNPQYYSTAANVRLIATFGVTSQTLTAADYLLDTKNPVLAAVPLVIDHSVSANQVALQTPTDDSTYQMMVSQNPDFSGASLETFASTYTPNPVLTDDPARIYLRIQDRYGNYTDSVASTPEKPGNIMYYDTSRSQDNLYQEFIAWDAISPSRSGSGSPVYEIYRKDNTQSNFSLLTTISNSDYNYYLDTGLDGSKTYAYKIRNRDSHGDASQYSAIIQDQPNGQGATDTTAPNISGVSISDVGTTTVAVNWTTDELADSSVGYSMDNTYLPERGIGSMTTSHRIILTNLNPGTVYYIRVKSRDAVGNLGQVDRDNPGASNIADFRFETSPGPAISSVTVPNISNNQATIAWKTTTNSSSYIVYSPNISNRQLDAPKEFGTPDLVGGSAPYNHSVTINSYNDQPLLNDTKYYFSVKSVDGTGNVAIDNNGGNFYELLTTADNVPPVISAIDAPVISQSSVTITWLTDESATSKVSYGEKSGGPYTDTQEINIYDRNHFVILTGLTPDTKYYFKVTSKDINGNESISSQHEFSTQKDLQFQHDPLSKIDNITTPVITDTEAMISYDSDQPANCILENGGASQLYNGVPIAEKAGAYDTHHSSHLMGLIFQTAYFYKISCKDNLDNIVESQEQTFTTKEKNYTASGSGGTGVGDLLNSAPPLVISNVKVAATTGESATVTWDTDQKGSSSVRYGLDSNYGVTFGDDLINSSKDNYVTSHSVIITGLVPATKYLFKTTSVDALGNIAESSEASFATAAPSSISSINAQSTSIGQATITWNTSNQTSSIVEYGLTTSYGEKKESNSLATDHSLDLTNLSQGVLYHYRVKGQDKDNKLYASSDQTFQPKSPAQITNVNINGVDEHSATVFFKTNVPTDSNVSYIDTTDNQTTGSQGSTDLTVDHKVQLTNLKQGTTFAVSISVNDEQGIQSKIDAPNFTTGKDTTPPTIENVKTDSALTQSDTVQTIISWKTNEQSSTSVVYKEGQNGEEKEIRIADNLTVSHIAVVTVFKPGTVYSFKVKSTDASGNEATSSDFAMLTPMKRANIIQIIISNFGDIFGWAKFN